MTQRTSDDDRPPLQPPAEVATDIYYHDHHHGPDVMTARTPVRCATATARAGIPERLTGCTCDAGAETRGGTGALAVHVGPLGGGGGRAGPLAAAAVAACDREGTLATIAAEQHHGHACCRLYTRPTAAGVVDNICRAVIAEIQVPDARCTCSIQEIRIVFYNVCGLASYSTGYSASLAVSDRQLSDCPGLQGACCPYRHLRTKRPKQR